MPEGGRPTSRKRSLDRISSPERLHELMPLVSPQDWLALLTLAVIVVALVTWGVYGHVPVSVNGRGVFLRPRRIVQWQSFTDGRVVSLNLRQGDSVRQGDALGTIDQSEIRKRLEQNRMLRAELIAQ